MIGNSFERPAAFDIQKHLAGAFGIYSGRDDVTVAVLFPPSEAGAVIDKPWHTSPKLAKEPDGQSPRSLRP